MFDLMKPGFHTFISNLLQNEHTRKNITISNAVHKAVDFPSSMKKSEKNLIWDSGCRKVSGREILREIQIYVMDLS